MNPLDQLAPLIDPEPISWWPPAPGWWLLGLALLLGLAALWRFPVSSTHLTLPTTPYV